MCRETRGERSTQHRQRASSPGRLFTIGLLIFGDVRANGYHRVFSSRLFSGNARRLEVDEYPNREGRRLLRRKRQKTSSEHVCDPSLLEFTSGRTEEEPLGTSTAPCRSVGQELYVCVRVCSVKFKIDA